jgi:hypothetical protein
MYKKSAFQSLLSDFLINKPNYVLNLLEIIFVVIQITTIETSSAQSVAAYQAQRVM